MSVPEWFGQIAWSDPVSVENLRANRQWLPRQSGVYAFTNYSNALEKNTGVLYVGKARSLLARVQSYLVDPNKVLLTSRRNPSAISSSLRHAGKAQLLVQIQQRARDAAPCGVWVRWSVCTEPAPLEELLLAYLKPAFNTHGIADADSDT